MASAGVAETNESILIHVRSFPAVSQRDATVLILGSTLLLHRNERAPD